MLFLGVHSNKESSKLKCVQIDAVDSEVVLKVWTI